MTPLILASTSPYRSELLSRLGLAFTCQTPLFDEEAAKNPALLPPQLALELSRGKARSLAKNDNCVIGGDQIVVLASQILGKPHTTERAVQQLTQMAGKTHDLLTAVTVIYRGEKTSFLDVTRLRMRPLTRAQIAAYVQADQPLDCAGSYKIEKHGLSLFEKIETEDFTAIQGLPLLKLSQILIQHGYVIPGDQL